MTLEWIKPMSDTDILLPSSRFQNYSLPSLELGGQPPCSLQPAGVSFGRGLTYRLGSK